MQDEQENNLIPKGERMKELVGIILVVVLFLISCVQGCYSAYSYNRDIGQCVRLADDASTPELKLQYLKQYKEAVMGISQEQARYVFTQSRYTKTAQIKTLDSLLIRLEQTTNMQPASMEYQQAMTQISGQEFDHALVEIDAIFWDCYRRENVFRWLFTFPSIVVK